MTTRRTLRRRLVAVLVAVLVVLFVAVLGGVVGGVGLVSTVTLPAGAPVRMHAGLSGASVTT